MRKADVYMHGEKAGILIEAEINRKYHFEYEEGYSGPPISVTLPIEKKTYDFESFPPFFEGLLPEGANLDILLRTYKIDLNSLFEILLAVGNDTVGAVTVREAEHEAMSDHI